VLAGLSTATTVSYAKRARTARGAMLPVVVVILLATAVMYGRVIAEIRVVAGSHAFTMILPILILTGVSIGVSFALWLATRGSTLEMPEPDNPTELKSALVFAGVYAIVLVLVAWTKEHVGDTGTYAVAALSGVADMDAITLSTGRLVSEGSMEPGVAWRAIVIGSVSNMVFKTGIAAALGGWRLAWRLGAAFGGIAIAGVALIFLWPT